VQLADVLDGIRVAQPIREGSPVALARYTALLAADLLEQVNRPIHDVVRDAAAGLEPIFFNLKGARRRELAQHLASSREGANAIARLSIPVLPRFQHAGVDRSGPGV
jgi:hypothetical protein